MQFFAIVSAMLAPAPEPAATTWYSNYDEAYRRAGIEGKPVLVVFSNRAASASDLKELAHRASLNRDFVPVFASKKTADGQKIFDTFKVAGDEACVVVEKTLQWQYCRYERALSDSELDRLLKSVKTASGVPTTDPLAVASNNYPPINNQITQPVNFSQPMIGFGTTSYGGWSSGAGANCLT